MSDPVYVYIGTYASEDAAKADLEVVRDLYASDVLRTYDAAVAVRDSDGKVHLHRHEGSMNHAVWSGAAVGALVGILFPPALIATTVLGAATGGLVDHLWRGISRGDLKDLGEALDAGEASLVVISSTEVDHQFAAALKATAHQIQRLEKADAKAFERELKSLSGS
ncbi:MAG TPA: DUF1269 domain-containing protein [Actinocrinis sp.]|uniref:DUF1269 domain-containing protein n=1 Tax=Actinocrinis sp. TaxID=1920516 RepID=UPI002DDCA3DA|nr:DUF1269 domain-containing protein [Actinocrinis sp.]HEV3174332.1 DUF1269 domain-containing protein [Actinocrinis sp.]